jgi:hypothetical protein
MLNVTSIVFTNLRNVHEGFRDLDVDTEILNVKKDKNNNVDMQKHNQRMISLKKQKDTANRGVCVWWWGGYF